MVKSSPQDNVSFVISELAMLLERGNAHASFEKAVKGIPQKLLGKVPQGSAYSIWQLVEHIRITQWDIMEFSRDPDHKSPKWPEEYWPEAEAPENAKAWTDSLEQIEKERKEFVKLLHKAGDGIYTPFPYGDGQSLFREGLVLADHNSYHTGEIILLRRILGDWG
ncbi:MAG TPA: DinB family protein [Puia sp.]